MRITNAAGYQVDILPKHQSKVKYLIANNQHDKVDELVNSYGTGGPTENTNKIYKATQDLPEVNITAPRTLSGSIAKAHENDSLLEAMASPLTIPFEAAQRAATHLFSGRYEKPSEAIVRTTAGQYLAKQAANPMNIPAKILSNPTVQDAVLDPVNLVGLGAIPRGVKAARNVVPLDDPIPIMDKIKATAKELYNKPFIPTTQVDKLPSNIELKTVPRENGFGVQAVDNKGNVQANLNVANLQHSPDYPMVTSVNVSDQLKGNRLQDVLYQKAIDEVRAKGLKGIRSGDSLTKPEITEALQGRFNKVPLESGSIRDIYGLEGHNNPNVIPDWMDTYSKMNKNKRVYVSPKDIINKLK